jgi:bifunctional non-homologous end joining protein LigD
MRVNGVSSPLPLGFVLPCLPTAAQKPPSGATWVHEIKHDGFDLLPAEMATAPVYLPVAGSIGRSDILADALASLRVRSIIVDGEAVWCGKDGTSNFDKLHSYAHDDEVFMYAFDLLELNGEDYRQHSLEKRKAKLEKLMARKWDAPFRTPRWGWRGNL